MALRKIVTIYVRILNEPVEAWEPASAEKVGENTYRILDTKNSFDRNYNLWEFPPDSLVACENKLLKGKNNVEDKYLVAVKLV